MKNLIFLLLIMCSTPIIWAQNGQAQFINYQGVALDNDGDAIANQTIRLELELRFGTPTASASYSELHNISTDASGVFNVQIGDGTPTGGNYNSLSWGKAACYVKADLNGTNIGISEIFAVPYALSAEKAVAMKINDLTNVTGNASSGDILGYNGSNWVPIAPASNSPWQENGSKIYYNSGSVGIGVSDPENGMDLHLGGDLLIQTNLGALHLGYPNNGNRWRIATAGAGADLLFRSKPSDQNGYNTRFNFSQDGSLGVNGDPTARLNIFQAGQAVGTGLRFNDGTANDDWDITHGFGLRFHYGGALKGVISANNGAYIQGSDKRLKQNIETLPTVLDKVAQLRPSTYTYIGSKGKTGSIGLLAQDVQPLFPELVYYSEVDDIYGIDYAGFSVIAMKAIQEQQKVISSQKNKIESLEMRLNLLEQKLN